MQLHVFVLHSYTLLPFLKDNVSFFKMMSLFKEEMPFFLKQNQQDISYYYYYCNNAGRASPTYSYYQHIILVLILPMYVLSFKCKLLDASMPNCMAQELVTTAGLYGCVSSMTRADSCNAQVVSLWCLLLWTVGWVLFSFLHVGPHPCIPESSPNFIHPSLNTLGSYRQRPPTSLLAWDCLHQLW